VLWNLLTNGIKFTPRGGAVSVRVTGTPEEALIEVSDDGEGILPEVLPYVFDRFRQADSSATRRHGGLGLGLSLVKHLVELHGGTVSAASDGPGRGASFSVRLPARLGPSAG
jgi:signal transduction histidine kinase